MDYREFNEAIALIRLGGLTPTHAHIAVAKLLLDRGHTASLDDLAETARDSGFCLSRETLAVTLDHFAARGLITEKRPDGHAVWP